MTLISSFPTVTPDMFRKHHARDCTHVPANAGTLRNPGLPRPQERIANSRSRTGVIQGRAKPCMTGGMTKLRPADLPPPVGKRKFIDFPAKFPAMLALAGNCGPHMAGNLLDVPEAAR